MNYITVMSCLNYLDQDHVLSHRSSVPRLTNTFKKIKDWLIISWPKSLNRLVQNITWIRCRGWISDPFQVFSIVIINNIIRIETRGENKVHHSKNFFQTCRRNTLGCGCRKSMISWSTAIQSMQQNFNLTGPQKMLSILFGWFWEHYSWSLNWRSCQFKRMRGRTPSPGAPCCCRHHLGKYPVSVGWLVGSTHPRLMWTQKQESEELGLIALLCVWDSGCWPRRHLRIGTENLLLAIFFVLSFTLHHLWKLFLIFSRA